MLSGLENFNIQVFPYNDLNKRSYSRNSGNFSGKFGKSLDNNMVETNEEVNYNIKTWENIFRGMQNLNMSQIIESYKNVMTLNTYGNLKTL